MNGTDGGGSAAAAARIGPRRHVRVVKVGGSLFDLPTLPLALRDWLDRQSPADNVLIAGGGPLADQVRQFAARFSLEPAAAHWACVDLLTASARCLATLLPDAQLLRSFVQLQAQLQSAACRDFVFAVADFLEAFEPSIAGRRLPHDWSASTDSIAARLAVAIGADELVLLKSIRLTPGLDAEGAATQGLVDEFLPIASQPLTAIRWVNLRDPRAIDLRWDCSKKNSPTARSSSAAEPAN